MKKNKQSNQPVMEQIKKGQVRMRSQLEIWAEKLGLGSGAILLALLAVFTMVGLMFWLKSNQDLVFGGYFPRFGIRPFLEGLPYLLIMLFVGMFILLSSLLKKYDFSYKIPFTLILSGLLGVMILFGGFAYGHPRLLPFFQKAPQFLKLRPAMTNNFVLGQVMEMNRERLRLQTIDQQSVWVLIDAKTFYPRGEIGLNDFVRVIGEWQDKQFKALVVASLEINKHLLPNSDLIPSYKPRFNNQLQQNNRPPNFKRNF